MPEVGNDPTSSDFQSDANPSQLFRQFLLFYNNIKIKSSKYKKNKFL